MLLGKFLLATLLVTGLVLAEDRPSDEKVVVVEGVPARVEEILPRIPQEAQDREDVGEQAPDQIAIESNIDEQHVDTQIYSLPPPNFGPPPLIHNQPVHGPIQITIRPGQVLHPQGPPHKNFPPPHFGQGPPHHGPPPPKHHGGIFRPPKKPGFHPHHKHHGPPPKHHFSHPPIPPKIQHLPPPPPPPQILENYGPPQESFLAPQDNFIIQRPHDSIVAPSSGIGGLSGIGAISSIGEELPPSYHEPAVNHGDEQWPQAMPDMPKIVSLEVKCEKNLMRVLIGFDKPFYGIVFSKGHYSNAHCVHLPAGSGKITANFDVSINSCGTTGNTENGLYGYGSQSGSGTYFENIMIIQYDPQVQEVWDQARKLRCTWHDHYEKSVTFRPFPVDMLDIVRADFAGDNVGCWMQIQVGKGPWASEVSGLVKIGQTMTMVLAIKDDEGKFDMLVRNCMAHDGRRAPIQLVDQYGCVTRPKLMSPFTKIKNFGSSASVLSYAYFQAFKFPDSMEVHFQCTIQICRYQCPDQCADKGHSEPAHPSAEYGVPGLAAGVPLGYVPAGRPREERRLRRAISTSTNATASMKDIGIDRVIQVVSSGDLTFALEQQSNENSTTTTVVMSPSQAEGNVMCMTMPSFVALLVILLAVLVVSSLFSAFLCIRYRPFSLNSLPGGKFSVSTVGNPVFKVQKNMPPPRPF